VTHARPGTRELPHQEIAAVVCLLELTHIRVGHEEYTRANGSYGLTTQRDRHVRVHGSELLFRFRGKSGQSRQVGICDRRLARIVSECSERALLVRASRVSEEQLLVQALRGSLRSATERTRKAS
jgi:DNA topoisomerase IB